MLRENAFARGAADLAQILGIDRERIDYIPCG
jgi:hypothetical protein